jgi:hypothetical protein
LREPSRRLGAEEPGADGYAGEVGLVAGALGNLARTPDQTLWVARGVDDGLWVEVDDRTLLLLRLGHGFTEFSSFGKVLGAGASGGVGSKSMHTARTPRLFVLVAIATAGMCATAERRDGSSGQLLLSATDSLQLLQR